jgi:hypothetical protein
MKIWRKFEKIELLSLDITDFWRRVKGRAKEKRIILEELSYKINVEYPTFRGWSYRNVFPDMQYIYYISQVLDTDIYYLLFGKAHEPEKKEDAIGDILVSLIKAVKNEL